MKFEKKFLAASTAFSVISSSIFSALPIGQVNQAELSLQYPVLILPANFTFGIWGLIYLSWILLAGGYFLGKFSLRRKTVFYFSLAMILSSLWLVASQNYYMLASMLILLTILYFLVLAFLHEYPKKHFWTYTIELFAWWVFAANLLNFHLLFVYYDMYFYPLVFSIISLVFAAAGYMFVARKYESIIPSFVFFWACFGIILRGNNETLSLFAGILGIACVWYALFSQKKKLQKLFKSLKK